MFGHRLHLTHIRLASLFWDLGKQCSPRSDASERGAWSGSALFANRNFNKNGWLVVLRLNVPVNNFSVMSGRSHRFLGNLPVLSGSKVSCSRTQHGGGRSRTPDLSLRSPTLYHWATALPFNKNGTVHQTPLKLEMESSTWSGWKSPLGKCGLRVDNET